MSNITEEIFKSIDVITDKKLEKLGFDRTKRGIVQSVQDTTADIVIDGDVYNCKLSKGVFVSEGDIVFVKFPQNDLKDKYVETALGGNDTPKELVISAQEILDKLKTVDGKGSKLDADLLGGISHKEYLTNADLSNKADKKHTHKLSELNNDAGFITNSKLSSEILGLKNELDKKIGGKANKSHTHSEYATKKEVESKADKKSIPTKIRDLEDNTTLSKDIKHSQYSSRVAVLDTRDVDDTPLDIMQDGLNSLRLDLKRRSKVGRPDLDISAHNDYAHILTMSSWSNYSGGYPTQISFGREKMGVRTGISNTEWSEWRKYSDDSIMFKEIMELKELIEKKSDRTYVDTELGKKANKTDVPTKLSELSNDADFITNTDLTPIESQMQTIEKLLESKVDTDKFEENIVSTERELSNKWSKEDLKIGGRNHYVNSYKHKLYENNSNNNSVNYANDTDGMLVNTVTSLGENIISCYSRVVDTPVEWQGELHMISADVFPSEDMELGIATDQYQFAKANMWTRIYRIRKSNSNETRIGLYSKNPVSKGATVKAKGFKLEKGSIATDWTPAFEDVKSVVNNMNDRIDNKVDFDGDFIGNVFQARDNSIGWEKNLLFNAQDRFNIESNHIPKSDFSVLFDGQLNPISRRTSVDDPLTLTISKLPDTHTQGKGCIGWVSRYRWATEFKIECFHKGEIVQTFEEKNYPLPYYYTPNFGSRVDTIKLTIYKAKKYNEETDDYTVQLSQIVFLHPEITGMYDNLLAKTNELPKSLSELTNDTKYITKEDIPKIDLTPIEKDVSSLKTTKADKTYVDTELGKKSDKSYVDIELNKKTNKTDLDIELNKKANKTDLDIKADKTYVDKELSNKANKDHTHIEYATKKEVNIKADAKDLDAVKLSMGNKADKTDIPNKLSQLSNDTGFITKNDIPDIENVDLTPIKNDISKLKTGKADRKHNHDEYIEQQRFDDSINRLKDVTEKELELRAYTTYVDSKLDKKADKTYVDKEVSKAGKVKSVNGKTGDVKLSAYDIESAIFNTDVDAILIDFNDDLDKKTEKTYVDSELKKKAEKVHNHDEYITDSNLDDTKTELLRELRSQMLDKADKKHTHKLSELNNDAGFITNANLSPIEKDVSSLKTTKVDKSYVDTGLDGKSDVTYVDAELSKKANKSHSHDNYVNKKDLDAKANKTDLDIKLNRDGSHNSFILGKDEIFKTKITNDSWSFINNLKTGGWARGLLEVKNKDLETDFRMGAYGTGQTFKKFFLGKSYQDYQMAFNPMANKIEMNGEVLKNGIEVATLQDIENSVKSKANKTDIPTKLSELNNDTGFITKKDIPEIENIDLNPLKKDIADLKTGKADKTYVDKEVSKAGKVKSVNGKDGDVVLTGMDIMSVRKQTPIDNLMDSMSIEISKKASKTELDKKADMSHSHSNYATITNLNRKADKTYVDEQVKQYGGKINTEIVSGLTSKGVKATTNDDIMTNAKKISKIEQGKSRDFDGYHYYIADSKFELNGSDYTSPIPIINVREYIDYDIYANMNQVAYRMEYISADVDYNAISVSFGLADFNIFNSSILEFAGQLNISTPSGTIVADAYDVRMNGQHNILYKNGIESGSMQIYTSGFNSRGVPESLSFDVQVRSEMKDILEDIEEEQCSAILSGVMTQHKSN